MYIAMLHLCWIKAFGMAGLSVLESPLPEFPQPCSVSKSSEFNGSQSELWQNLTLICHWTF